MTDFWMATLGWATHSAGVGAVVLLLGWLGVLCTKGAAAKHLIGVWSIRAAVLAPVLCLLPAWLTLPVEWNGRCTKVEVVASDAAPISQNSPAALGRIALEEAVLPSAPNLRRLILTFHA